MNVLGIESSCDETAAAVVGDGPRLVTSIIHSQVATHARFGGIVPEVASREHVARIVDVTERALEGVGMDHIDAIAVTRGPGLVGSLLVGLHFAKGLAMARGIPWLGVNHLEGHLAAALLCDPPPTIPHLALLVSGGHTQLYDVRAFGRYAVVGGTRDDAAGEAFDKIAKLLGLGYPGGLRIEQASAGGDPAAIALPRGMPSTRSFDLSFSGLKTAAAEYIARRGGKLEGQELADFCASAQEAICDILTRKAVAAAASVRAPGIVLAGGVAANKRLRELLDERTKQRGLWSFAPPKSLCTDNAGMIAAAGWMRLKQGEASAWEDSALSRWPLDDRRVDPRYAPRRRTRTHKTSGPATSR